MPITRQSNIDPLYTVVQLLSYLQLEGRLDHLDVPDWATGGTSVEELIETLELIGDGEWLAEAMDRDSVPDVVDEWIRDFLNGKPVVSPDDPLPESEDDEDE